MKQIAFLFIIGAIAFIDACKAQTLSSGEKLKTQTKFPKAGEWPAFRRTGTLEAHSPLKSNITNPAIEWKQFVGALESRVVVESADGNTKLLLPSDATEISGADSIALTDFIPLPKNEEDNNISRTTTFADVFPEYPGKEKLEFESTFDKPFINGQYARTFGRCYAKQNDQWITVWQTNPIKDLFVPLPLVGDFDGDGTQEIAILPFYQLKLIDARTGQTKDSCRFNDNRSYGFHGVYDFEGDGKWEFLVQADFSKHVDVLGYRDGKLTLLWQQNIEQDVAHPQKIMRVATDPVMDIDGDGHPEVILSLFNDSSDGRWHLSFLDALTGHIKVDFPDEQFSARMDLDGDGESELLTTCTRGVSPLKKIRARTMKGSKPSIIWEKENADWQTWNLPLPRHVKSMAALGKETVLARSDSKYMYVLIRETGLPRETKLSLVRWEGATFKTVMTITGENLDGLGFDSIGRLLVRSRHRFGQRSDFVIAGGHSIKQTTRRIGSSPGSAVVAWPDKAKLPTIVVQGSTQDQVTFQPPRKDGQNVQLNYISGRGQGVAWPNTLGPVIVDLAGDGRRQIIVADAAPSGAARISVKDLNGRVVWQHEFALIVGTPLPQNTGGVVLWQAGHFTHPIRQDVLVTTQRSRGGSEESSLLSGEDGHVLWHRYKQISKRGVGGNSFAIADYDGDGLDDIGSLWPSIFYLMKGSTGEDILAMDTKWKQVYDKQVYFGQAVAGNFMNEGTPAIFFSGRLMTGVIRLDGTLVWFDAVDKSPGYLPSFGDFNGDGRSDVLAAGFEDGMRCYDMASGKVSWRMHNPTDGLENFGQPSPVKGSASADLDSDGRDEALIVIDKTLLCIGIKGGDTTGKIFWRVEFPSHIGPPTVVTLKKDGPISILVAGDDGFVYCVEQKSKP